MEKRLGMMMSDEEDAGLHFDRILKNKTKFDQLTIGCVGPIGENLLKLQNKGITLIPITSRLLPHGTMRNIFTELIFSDSQFNDFGVFLNIDTDEELTGHLPTWDRQKYPDGANILYPYKYPFKNSYWLNNAGFVGRRKPTWLGLYHSQVSPLDKTWIINSFFITHHRVSDGRKHDGVQRILDLNETGYDTQLALIHNILDRLSVNSLPNDPDLISHAEDIFKKLKFPDMVAGAYQDMYMIRRYTYGFRLFLKAQKMEQAKHYVDQLIHAQQRIGYLYQLVLNRSLDRNILMEKYRTTTDLQFADIIDVNRFTGWTN